MFPSCHETSTKERYVWSNYDSDHYILNYGINYPIHRKFKVLGQLNGIWKLQDLKERIRTRGENYAEKEG